MMFGKLQDLGWPHSCLTGALTLFALRRLWKLDIHWICALDLSRISWSSMMGLGTPLPEEMPVVCGRWFKKGVTQTEPPITRQKLTGGRG